VFLGPNLQNFLPVALAFKTGQFINAISPYQPLSKKQARQFNFQFPGRYRKNKYLLWQKIPNFRYNCSDQTLKDTIAAEIEEMKNLKTISSVSLMTYFVSLKTFLVINSMF
jgi:hypothetical protein